VKLQLSKKRHHTQTLETKIMENQESIQLLNTAIIKTKEKKIDSSYEERLSEVCEKPALKAVSFAIAHLSETQKISRDMAAMEIVEAIRELDNIWGDYVMMEGIGKLKDLLKGQTKH
jgi:tRNA U34 5-carboxymethylaminomethyl modifying GTPase MnmE/TrmE